MAQTPNVSNLSTRAQVGVGGDAIFAGFNVGAGGSKTVLIRASGPALAAFGVGGVLADPKIELFSGSEKISENDNWNTPVGSAPPVTPATFSSVGAFAFSAGSRDAALVAIVSPGSYTAIISGVGGTTGVALLEVYELTVGSARLTNISARAQVGTGGNILIPGFVISPGTGVRRLLVRAAGPALTALGVGGVLVDPTMTVLNASGATVASNDNWGALVGAGATTATVLSDAFVQSGAFAFASGSRDAALIADFGPGNYTIQVSGAGGSSGVALVEVYDISPAPSVSTNPPPAPPPITPAALTLDSLYGTYRRDPVQNDYHTGTISLKSGAGATAVLQWTNAAKVSWNLLPDLARLLLLTDATNPYQNTGIPNFKIEVQSGLVVGFSFQGEFYARDGAPRPILARSGGLNGYISATISRPPVAYAYGYSFYTTIWPLLEKHLSGFQVGLAGSWIQPNNDDFTQPLLPLGAGTIREASPERASTYWRDVFQTIEGSSGYWTNLHFPAATPKLRMNGTANGYKVEISSPGWAWGNGTALTRDNMGIAQLSNRLLVPPDGMTYRQGTNGEVTGVAWMALPFTPAKPGGLVPIGEQSWTLFLNTANFKGPVAFWIPDVWTRLSRSYPIIQGRGMDVRPTLMGGGAMEFNTVPYFENASASGVRYSRVPRLTFPVDAQGNTYIMQDVTAYSTTALSDGVRAWIAGGASVNGKFNPAGAFKPTLRANAISFTQGASDATKIPITGYETTVLTAIFPTPGSTAFGLRWSATGTIGALPEYFTQSGTSMRAITADDVPADTRLTALNFPEAGIGAAYTSPASATDSWSTPAPRAGPFTVTLVDGTVVTYSWYRFADQPALQALGWSSAEKEALQAIVEKIHAAWAATDEFMAPPSRGTLVTLDSAMVVTPPAGLEIGYVPIVTRQGAP
ncbi:MAG: hypothetical protein EXS37_01055 [Opitutus sp.]|nr:hypothetical protein [Opitutus sp.]